jgi:hypothetical protein
VQTIGSWLHLMGADLVPVCQVARRPDFWQMARLSEAELRQFMAVGLLCEFAIEARTLTDGTIQLKDGAHRWAVARDLGLPTVPVLMEQQATGPDVWAFNL